jgi:hypothetical protein
MSQVLVLKTTSSSFLPIRNKHKTLELRWDDRNYQSGDLLLLKEIDALKRYTGAKAVVLITHVLNPSFSFGSLNLGYVALSIRLLYHGNSEILLQDLELFYQQANLIADELSLPNRPFTYHFSSLSYI